MLNVSLFSCCSRFVDGTGYCSSYVCVFRVEYVVHGSFIVQGIVPALVSMVYYALGLVANAW